LKRGGVGRETAPGEQKKGRRGSRTMIGGELKDTYNLRHTGDTLDITERGSNQSLNGDANGTVS